MDNEPQIPFGYRRVQGQSQKGDGVWDVANQCFRKVKKCYPTTEPAPLFIIRKCAVEQAIIPVLPGEEEV